MPTLISLLVREPRNENTSHGQASLSMWKDMICLGLSWAEMRYAEHHQPSLTDRTLPSIFDEQILLVPRKRHPIEQQHCTDDDASCKGPGNEVVDVDGGVNDWEVPQHGPSTSGAHCTISQDYMRRRTTNGDKACHDLSSIPSKNVRCA